MLKLLLDQNIPYTVKELLLSADATREVIHTNEVQLSTATDRQIFDWAIQNQAVIVTFDSDFARLFIESVEQKPGIIRLRVAPTTASVCHAALERLMSQVKPQEIQQSLIIVGTEQIRLRQYPAD